MIRLRVRELAEQRGFNMSSLSRKADVSFRTVKRLWKDPYHPVNTTTIEKLAKALEVKSGELLEDQEKTWNRIFDQPMNS